MTNATEQKAWSLSLREWKLELSRLNQKIGGAPVDEPRIAALIAIRDRHRAMYPKMPK